MQYLWFRRRRGRGEGGDHFCFFPKTWSVARCTCIVTGGIIRLSQHMIPKRITLAAKCNRIVNVFRERTQWDFWLGRPANLPAAASSLWRTSSPDAEEGVGTASPPPFRVKGGSPPSLPHCNPECSAHSLFMARLHFPSGQKKLLKRAERTAQNMAQS